MAMFKSAQLLTNTDEEFVVALPMSATTDDDEEEMVVYQPEKSVEEDVEMCVPTEQMELSFTLPFLPGAPDDVVEISGDELEVGINEKEDKEKDKSKAADQPRDLNWIKDYLNKIPRHKGENLGIERAKSYLSRGLNMLSKMLQEDHDGKIDISKAEDARIEMENGVERLEKELMKRKKKASTDKELTKEAQKIAGVGGIIVTVPLKISRIARVCINSAVSGGKDIEDIMRRQSDKWKLTADEKADLVQLIQDMGYYVRRDRGFMVDDEEKYGYSSENNYDLPPNYQA